MDSTNHYSNIITQHKYKHKYNDINLKYKGHYERNISSNLKDMNSKNDPYEANVVNHFTNFDYNKKYDRTTYHLYKEKLVNNTNEKELKGFSGYKDHNTSNGKYKDLYKSSKIDK